MRVLPSKAIDVFNILNILTALLKDNSLVSLKTRFWLSTIMNKYYIFKIIEPIPKMILSKYIRSLKSQKKLIHERCYDLLVVLDACRYDIFSQIIYKYLDGYLIPVKSPASVTIEWLRNVWSNRYWNDIVYVSASPMVNKRGLIRDFDARKTFLYIEEVWDWGWDEELSTVPPNKVNFAIKLAQTKLKLKGLKFRKDYRIVAHYVQPHAPYIMFKNITKIISESSLSKDVTDIALRRFGYFTGKFAIDHILLSILKEYFNDATRVNIVLRKAYEENLHWVLRYVSQLVSEVDGRVVITTDHGELLGEYGLYFHMTLPLPQLRIVPWFIVK